VYKDWSEPFVEVQQLMVEIKSHLNANDTSEAAGIAREMLDKVVDIHAAILMADWVNEEIARMRREKSNVASSEAVQ
jgi:hypothetical protein